MDETLPPPPGVVCYTAVVTQRSSLGGALRDDTKNTFEGEGVGFIEMGGLYDGISSPRMQSGKAHYNKLEVIQGRIKNKSELPAGE